MYSVRTTKTASRATAVQIIQYEQRRKIILKHIGSAHTPEELTSLKRTACDWIEKETGQPRLFPERTPQPHGLIPLSKCQYLGFRYTFIYEIITDIFRLIRLDGAEPLLRDLALIRIVEPASKLESLKLLTEYFGKTYHRTDLYRRIPTFVSRKGSIERNMIAFAQTHFSFDFSLVFYDVTTLYFESFQEDTFKTTGFSKDNKSNQPQVVIGLIVTKEGFPVSYEVFEGNTFEGKTFIPTIVGFKDTHSVTNLTVVADAAMISLDNIERLKEHDLSYIVGARVANLTRTQMKTVSEVLGATDGKTYRMETERGLLVCDFSLARYQKDKREMDKQIAKAEKLIKEKQALKRTKFVKSKRKATQVLHTELIEKTTLLLGIKGYYTNLTDSPDATIIDQYHALWHIEQAFRIAKSDLAMRPIYHFKKQTIEAHILICFMALAVCKYMELKTGRSTKKLIKLFKSVTDARLKNLLTSEEIILRSQVTEELRGLVKSLRY